MEYDEDEFLNLAGLQHFAFCRRQWALIHIEQQWNENLRTAEGHILHENAHDSLSAEKRGNLSNTLYVTSQDAYLALDGENVVIQREENEARRIPLHNLDGIVTFGYTGASPALMGACAERGVALTFLTMHGRFLARVSGTEQGKRRVCGRSPHRERGLKYFQRG